MRTNRSIPGATVIPELPYADVGEAARWLAEAFGFTVRLRIANHRIQMNVGDGAVVLIEARGSANKSSLLVRVENVEGHHNRAKRAGAHVLGAPETHAYGERQYAAQDIAGHRWTFSESVADVAPETWGGASENL